MFGKRAWWRRTANEIYWMMREPRVARIRLVCLGAYLRLQLTDTSPHEFLDEAAFRASRKSDQVFIFGSGWSLNEITPEEWAHMAGYDTFGFSMFVYQQWIRTDYHMLRELYIGQELNKDFWLPYSQEFVDYFDQNPYFKDTILLAQAGYRSLTVNRMLALKMFKRARRMVRFKVVNGDLQTPPNYSLAVGVVHAVGSLTDIINLAVIGGWQDIILVGVDLYNAVYFWEEAHHSAATFGKDPNAIHNTVNNGIIQFIGFWREELAKQGITLWVYNPKSLLAEVLPVYQRSK